MSAVARKGDPIHFDAPVQNLAFSPDGATLAVSFGRFAESSSTTDRNRPRLVDVATGRTRVVLAGQHVASSAVAFNRGGTTVATGGADGRIVLHDVATGEARGQPLEVGHGFPFVVPEW